MTYIPHIITSSSVTVIIDGIPSAITSSHANFQEVIELLTTGDYTIEYLQELMKPIIAFKAAVNSSEFYFMENAIYLDVNGYPFQLAHQLEQEVLRVKKASGNLDPLVNFVTKLANNPYKDVHNQLYGFLQACGLALTEDGDFLAYKNVNTDFTDVYTGTMDNSPGKTVEMPRHAVAKDPNITCAAGLHFAAWGYLANYAPGRKTVILKINPADVVSIPTDYNNMKGRACQYYVLKEVEQPEELKNTTVFDITAFMFNNDYDVDYDDDYDDYYNEYYDEYCDLNDEEIILFK
jgi:hypothetical protein